MEPDCSSSAADEIQAEGRTPAHARSSLSERNSVCPSQWHSLGDAAQGTWLRLRNDVLEALTRLAGCRYLGLDPFRAIGLAFPLQPNRLVKSSRRQLFNTSCFWGPQTGPNPTDRAKLGSKRHLICDGQGVPLAVQLSGANRNDSQQALPLVDAIPLLQGERGRPRFRPDCVIGDRGYDARAIREGLRMRGISPRLAQRYTEHGSGLGRYRWVVERTFAWLNQFRRLRVRYEKRSDIHEAFLSLGCALICWRFLRSAWMRN